MMAAGDMELRDGVWLRGVPVALRPQLSTLRDHCLQSSAVFADVVSSMCPRHSLAVPRRGGAMSDCVLDLKLPCPGGG